MRQGPMGVALVGAGAISAQYLENLTRMPDLEVLAVADLDRERAAARAAEYGVPTGAAVEEVLADPDVELVVNLTIPAAHMEVALAALRAGKHVWSEKPFAVDRAGSRAVLAEAESLGLRAAGAPDTFLGDAVQTARRLVEEGRIGEPLTALTLFQAAGPEAWHPNPEFFYAPGGGPLFDIGPYYLTALVQLLGPVARVAASASTARPTRVIASGPRAGTEFPVHVATHLGALIEFENGTSAQSTFSFQSPQRRVGFFEVGGSDATLVLADPNGFDGELAIITREGREVVETHAAVGRGHGVLELARAIRAGLPERASGELAAHVVDVMASIDEAAAGGGFVDVASSASPGPALPPGWDPLAATLLDTPS